MHSTTFIRCQKTHAKIMRSFEKQIGLMKKYECLSSNHRALHEGNTSLPKATAIIVQPRLNGRRR